MIKDRVQKLMLRYGGGGGGGGSGGSSKSDGFQENMTNKKRKRNAPPPLLASSSEVGEGDGGGDRDKGKGKLSGELFIVEAGPVSDCGHTMEGMCPSFPMSENSLLAYSCGLQSRTATNNGLAHLLARFMKWGGHVLLGSEAPAAVPPIKIGLPPFPNSTGDIRSVSVIYVFPTVAAFQGQVVRTREGGRRRPQV